MREGWERDQGEKGDGEGKIGWWIWGRGGRSADLNLRRLLLVGE